MAAGVTGRYLIRVDLIRKWLAASSKFIKNINRLISAPNFDGSERILFKINVSGTNFLVNTRSIYKGVKFEIHCLPAVLRAA